MSHFVTISVIVCRKSVIMNQIWNYNHYWFLKLHSVVSSTMLILSSMTLSPSPLEGACISVASGTAWNFYLQFWPCQQHFLKNMFTSQILNSEVFLIDKIPFWSGALWWPMNTKTNLSKFFCFWHFGFIYLFNFLFHFTYF